MLDGLLIKHLSGESFALYTDLLTLPTAPRTIVASEHPYTAAYLKGAKM